MADGQVRTSNDPAKKVIGESLACQSLQEAILWTRYQRHGMSQIIP